LVEWELPEQALTILKLVYITLTWSSKRQKKDQLQSNEARANNSVSKKFNFTNNKSNLPNANAQSNVARMLCKNSCANVNTSPTLDRLNRTR